LPQPPTPLIDVERSLWELQIIAAYADCRRRHSALVESWPG
jgi:hypothetical protein